MGVPLAVGPWSAAEDTHLLAAGPTTGTDERQAGASLSGTVSSFCMAYMENLESIRGMGSAGR